MESAPLGATVTLDDFDVRIHPQSRKPERYISYLRIEEAGRTRPGRVEVNHTEKVGGFILHQNSYGAVLSVELTGFVANLKVQDGRVVSEGDAWANPAIQVTFFQGDEPVGRAWLFYRPEFRDFSMTRGLPFHLRCVRLLPGAEAETTGTAQASLADLRPEVEVCASPQSPPFARLALQTGRRVAMPLAGQNDGSAAVAETRDMTRALVGLDYDTGTSKVRVACELNAGESKPLNNGDQLDLTWRNGVLTARVRGGDGSVREFPLTEGARATQPAGAATGPAASRYSLAGFEKVSAHYTVLGVTRNPGIVLIYPGCFLLCLGPFLAFLSRWRRIHVAADTRSGAVLLGGRGRFLEPVKQDVMAVRMAVAEAVAAPVA